MDYILRKVKKVKNYRKCINIENELKNYINICYDFNYLKISNYIEKLTKKYEIDYEIDYEYDTINEKIIIKLEKDFIIIIKKEPIEYFI